MKRYELFIKVFEEWRERFGIKPIPIKQDNRIDTHAMLETIGNKATLVYNTKRMPYKPKAVITLDALHELGHLIDRLSYNTKKQKIYAEYRAELFSLIITKKYYTRYYNFVCKRMKKYLWGEGKNDHSIHNEAFRMIPDYK